MSEINCIRLIYNIYLSMQYAYSNLTENKKVKKKETMLIDDCETQINKALNDQILND